MAKTALDRAERLFSAGRYAQAVTLLEPQVPVYRESQRFYYVLGASCLRTGDVSGAFAYLKRAEQLLPGNADVALALSALQVRRGETEKAVEGYLRVLEERPRDRLARRALSLIRREGSPERLAALVESGRIARIYPGGFRIMRLALPSAALALVLAAAWLLLPLAVPAARRLLAGPPMRPGVAAVVLSSSERSAPVTTGGGFRFVLTEDQALSGFEKAKAYFQAYRDNAALVEINRLLGSNASQAVKDKARTLKAFVGAPDFRTVRDAPSFAELGKDPMLYDGCSVSWKGMAANVRAEGRSLAFDFLVGYDRMKQLEGIIPARMAGAEVPVDRPLEILALIRSADGSPRLDAVAIHELLQER